MALVFLSQTLGLDKRIQGGGDCEVFSGVICKIANLQENIYACYLKYIYFYSSLLLTIYYIEE